MIQKKLSVNLAVLFDKPTGIGVYLRNLLDHLKILNPTLLTNKLNPEFDCYLIPPGLTPNEGTKGHFRRLIWTQFQLPKIQKKLHSQLLFTPIPEAPLYQKQSFVTTVHDFIPLRFPRRFSPLSIYYRYYVPQVCRQAKHILTVSESTANDLIDFYGVSSKKITPVLLAYDFAHFQRSPIEKSKDNPYFLYIGRHDTYKNSHRLIDAFANFCRQTKDEDYQLRLVGPFDPRYTPQLQQQAQSLGLSQRVIFIDSQYRTKT